jgi:hypothetical protein
MPVPVGAFQLHQGDVRRGDETVLPLPLSLLLRTWHLQYQYDGFTAGDTLWESKK